MRFITKYLVIFLCICSKLSNAMQQNQSCHWLVVKLEGAAVGDPRELGVGSGAPAVQGAAPHHHQLPRVLGEAAHLDAGGAGEQTVPGGEE